MVRTQSDREKRREERLKSLPSSERAFRMATIKKKEGRPLNSEERHALRMHGFLGTVYQAATSIRKSVEETVRAEAINEVIELLRPEFTKHCRSPTLTRIIQSCIRCGTPQHLASITSLLTSEDAQSLLTDPCGRHTICSLLRHTTASSFAMYWNNVLIPNACKIVEFQPGLAVLSSAVTAPYSTPGKRGELVLAALISPEERKRLASNSKNIGEERDGHVLPWKSWPLPCSQGPPHRVLQERLRVLSEKLVNKKSCDLIFSHLILETALGAYDAARNEANDSAKTSCPDNSANGSPLSGADSSEWYAEVIEAVREEFLSSSGSTLPLKGMTSARLVLRIFLESSPKSRRNLLQSLHGYAVEYASSVSGAALLSAIIDLNADAQVTYRYIIAPWLERLDELCTPVAFRHFSKLLHRLCIVNAANKNKAVPQLWREALDLDHIQTPHKLAEDTWNIIAIRHCRLVSRFLVRFIPHVLDLEAQKNLGSSASQSQPRASLLSMGSFRTTLRGIFNQISSLLEMEECDDQLKKYCQSDLQYSSFVQGLKAKKSGTMEDANSVGTTSKGGKRVRKEKFENIPVNKVYEKRVFFESDDDDDENEEVQKGALRNDDTMDEKPPVPKKKRVLKKA